MHAVLPMPNQATMASKALMLIKTPVLLAAATLIRPEAREYDL